MLLNLHVHVGFIGTSTVFPAKTANFRFEEPQLKYFFHEIPMSYI